MEKDGEWAKRIEEINAETQTPYDSMELSINAKGQITGKIKMHYDGQDTKNKYKKWTEAMIIINNIKRANNPERLLSPQVLTDKDD